MNWTCPFCQHHHVVTDEVSDVQVYPISVGETKYGSMGIHVAGIRCVNRECNELTLWVNLGQVYYTGREYKLRDGTTERIDIKPQGSSRPQPQFIAAPILEDYREACQIRHLSSKASATLARRCLQGMIRDFCGIAKNRLIDEITELRKQVDDGTADRAISPDTLDAIDAVRRIGNIGAHMEKDIDLIVDVDPGEAQALIELIELLFEEWYVARHTREQRVKRITAMAATKDAELAELKAAKAQLAIAAPAGETGF